MKFFVRRLGALERADIEIKPLTVFVGPNNAGKTWLAYTLAGFLGDYGSNEYARFLVSSNELRELYPSLNKLIQQLLDEGNATIDIVQFAKENADVYFKRVANRARNWMRDYLGTKRARFGSLKVGIDLTEKKKYFEQVLRHSVNVGFPRGLPRSQPLLRAVKNEGNPIFYFYAEERITEKLPPQEIRMFLIENVLKVLHGAIYSQTYIFPTERTTFLTLLSGTRLAPLTSTSAETASQVQSISNPLQNFLNMVGSILLVDLANREKEAQTNSTIGAYLSFSRLLEQGILNGEMEITSSSLELMLELLFKPNRDVSLELLVASSMVKELSPFILYLRGLAKMGELLVIDEPEMNLHPIAQVRFMELLAMMVNSGLNVLFTTHSTYMVDHLANLIRAKNVKNQEEIRNKFFLKSADAFLSRDQVSAYLFEHGTARTILDEDGTINWSTFSNVSDQVTDIFLELVERELVEKETDSDSGNFSI